MDTNIMAQIGANLKKGNDGKAVDENGEYELLHELKCRVGFSHSVREYDKQDGKKGLSNNIRCYKFEIAGQQGQQPAAYQAPPQAQPAASQSPFQPLPDDSADELPF